MTIILEGPDGAGKTTLVQELQHHFPKMEVHPRFCTSKGGPIADLAEEVYKDVKTYPTHYIYDRHPVISEFIYSTTIPSRSLSSAFLSDTMGRIRQRVALHSLVIWCIPPFSVVKRNIEQDQDTQMDGVASNIDRIYEQYLMHKLMWPGRSVNYDYTNSAMSWEGLRYALGETKDKLWRDAS